MDSYRPQQPPLRKTGATSGAMPRRGLAVALAVIGGLLIVAGVLLVTVPLHHGTIPQWNGLCSSDVGQIGQFIDSSAQQDCGEVSLADHLIGWLFGGGIALLAGGLFWLTRRPRRTGA
jgi:hypothetical protein